jgi:6-phospho-beta-glucosidase
MDPYKITIVGGGAFAPRLCEVLAAAVHLPELEIRLSARRLDRVSILADHAARRVAALRPGWSVRAGSLETAVEGARIVVLLVRVGGFEARAWDDEFPRRFGLPGDEGLGPGGIANAWRTLPELAPIVQTLRQLAPGARVLNLMAPLGVTTRFLLDAKVDAVGLCELPLVTIDHWLTASGNAAAVTWRYAGLNHLGWFWDVRRQDDDVLARLAATPRAEGGPAPLDPATLERYQAAPLRYFYEIFDRDAGRRLTPMRSSNRAAQLKAISETLVERFSSRPGAEAEEAEARPTPWLDRAVAPVASAFLGGAVHAGFANLRNDELIPELPPELVVEVAATYSAAGVQPVIPGPLPVRVAEFLRQAAEVESLTYLAASRRDPAMLHRAMQALPLPIPKNSMSELVRLVQERPPENVLQGKEQR